MNNDNAFPGMAYFLVTPTSSKREFQDKENKLKRGSHLTY